MRLSHPRDVIAVGAAPIELGAEDGAPRLSTERFTLPCGLDVVVHPDPSLPQVAVSVWYHVGAADERPGTSGLAHLFEHLFKNSEHLQGRHHYDILRSIGASDANASTGIDRTAYHQIVPAHQLEVALWLESDRMGYFLPAMNRLRLEAQQQVVRSERRQRYENVPYGAERFAAAAALYPEFHPLRHLVIGRHEDIAAASLDDIVEFYKTWYVPANAHLVVAGAVEVATVRRLVDRYFGSFPGSRPPSRVVPSGAAAVAPRAVVTRVPDRFATLPRLHFAWRGPAALTEDATALEMLTGAWAQPGTGALWKRLVYHEQLAQRMSAWVVSHRLGTEVHVTIDVRDGVTAGRVRIAFDEELARIAAESVEVAAMARVLARREAGALWALQGISRRAADLQRNLLWYREPNGFAREAVRWRSVTPETVRGAALTWLVHGQRIEIHTEPLASGSASALSSALAAGAGPRMPAGFPSTFSGVEPEAAAPVDPSANHAAAIPPESAAVES
jgi:zinc protease